MICDILIHVNICFFILFRFDDDVRSSGVGDGFGGDGAQIQQPPQFISVAQPGSSRDVMRVHEAESLCCFLIYSYNGC